MGFNKPLVSNPGYFVSALPQTDSSLSQGFMIGIAIAMIVVVTLAIVALAVVFVIRKRFVQLLCSYYMNGLF